MIPFRARNAAVRHRGRAQVRLRGGTLIWALLGLAGCQGAQPLPSEVITEQWELLGVELAKTWDENTIRPGWIVSWEFPKQELRRIASKRLPAPDGWEPVRCVQLAYNEGAGLVAVGAYRNIYGDETNLQETRGFFQDVWVHDLQTSKSKWIARKRWRTVSFFAWSPDGKKLTFMATELEMQGTTRSGSVYVYDIATGGLVQLADDAAILSIHLAGCPPPPTWNEDGTHLYYVSISGDVGRIEMNTLKKEILPIHASRVVTVRGAEIVYVTEHIPKWEPMGGAQVIKRELDARPGTPEAQGVLLYTGCELGQTLASPSRRFILLGDRRDYYGGGTVLIDIEKEDYSFVDRYLPVSRDWGEVYAGQP